MANSKSGTSAQAWDIFSFRIVRTLSKTTKVMSHGMKNQPGKVPTGLP